MRQIQLYISQTTDPYFNLATEQYLLENQPVDSCTLYLWQNENTVVIGRNQNPWKECRVSALEQDGGRLARRLSGGGAVFHDLGNLNFTFLTREENYDLDSQLSVIQCACGSLGIATERSGRNDLLADGRKFSGNAFYNHKGLAYHHGTLLIRVDGEKLQRYLSPPKAKLEAKGIDSVRSRVINLADLCPDLTCETMKEAMIEAFRQIYDAPMHTITLSPGQLEQIQDLRKKYADWQWLFGPRLPMSFSCQQQFPWGNVLLELQVDSGTVAAARCYTDAMDWLLADAVEASLTGCRFTLPDLQQALQAHLSNLPQILQDLLTLLQAQDI